MLIILTLENTEKYKKYKPPPISSSRGNLTTY